MSKWIIAILFLISMFSSYVAYHYRDKLSTEEKQSKDLVSKIEHLQQQAIKTNQIIAENTTVKRELENESIKQQEQIKKLLADDTCANTLIPVRVAEWLHNRADKIRQSTGTSQSNK